MTKILALNNPQGVVIEFENILEDSYKSPGVLNV